MIIENDIKLDFSDVLFKPQRSTLSSRKEVDLEREIVFRNTGKVFKGIPVIAANMDTTGTFEMGTVLAKNRMMTALHKHYTLEDWEENASRFNSDFMTVSIGTKDEDYDKFTKILSLGIDVKYLTIDVANGYSEKFINFVADVKKRHPSIVIMAGNVVSSDITQELILNGADVVKVGIGPGSVCTTRLKAGVGVPQFSAVVECANAAHGLSGHIISDGGVVHTGDVSKAFGAGADFVMMGSMFAGHDESGGELIERWYRGNEVMKDVDGSHLGYLDEHKKYKAFYGMSSKVANDKYAGGLANYRSSEGRETLVSYKGPVSNTIRDIKGSIASTMTYIGAKRLKDVPKCATFVRVNNTHNKIYEK